jgi:hypothetical protein
VTRSTEDGHSGCLTSYDPDWNCPGYAHQGWMAFDNSTIKERSFVLIYMKWNIWKDCKVLNDFARSRIRLPHWFCFQPWEECQWFGIRSAEDGNFHQLSYRCWVFQVVTPGLTGVMSIESWSIQSRDWLEQQNPNFEKVSFEPPDEI